MLGRLGIGIAVAMALATTGRLSAQQFLQPPPGAAPPNAYSAGGPYAPAPNPGGPYAAPYGGAPYAAPPGAPFAGPYGPPPGMAGPAPYGGGPGGFYPPNGMGMGCPGGCPGAPGDCNACPGGNPACPPDVDVSPFEEALCRMFHNATFQLDYLHWGISHPGNAVIGAVPSLTTLNPNFDPNFPTNPIGSPPLITDPRIPFSVPGGVAQSLDTSPLSLAGNSGISATLTIPYTWGTGELTGFILQRADSKIFNQVIPVGLAGDQEFIALGLTSAGQPSSNLLLFSRFFSADFRSLVFGGEVNFVFNSVVPKQYGFNWMPLVGFRYLGIQETFDVDGFDSQFRETTVHSRTLNNIFGPQVGLRFEFVHQHFTIGAEPKFAFGINDMLAGVDSSIPTQGESSDVTNRILFSPVGALNVYAKIPLHENFRLFVAYNLIGAGNISRPSQQIAYDETAAGANNIHLNFHDNTGILIQGYSVGGEFSF